MAQPMCCGLVMKISVTNLLLSKYSAIYYDIRLVDKFNS
jgi:hypothetical protein